ncbi:MAG: SulP family inorganic anion transporter [Candidatus Nanopelagicales bacterium]
MSTDIQPWWKPQPRAPGVRVLTGYQRKWLRGDVVGGLTVAAYLIPQVMAYATIAGLDPVAGLWAILPAMVLYGFLGTSRLMSVGPESTTALMTAAAIGPIAYGDAGRYALLASALALATGLICLLFWLVKLGFIADLLSLPILVGYMTGIAVIMIVGQLDKLTGVAVTGDNFVDQIRSFAENISAVHTPTLILGLSMLAFLLIGQHYFPQLPIPLLAVLLATAITFFFGLQDVGIKVVGEVPSGLPSLALPSLHDIWLVVLPAFGVVLVGYTDNMLTARAFVSPEHDPVDANQELLALGVSNIGAGIVRGFPVSSSASRTAIGQTAGTESQVYSFVAAAVVVATLLFLGPVLADFPTAALGAIVVFAALRLIDLAGFRRIADFRIAELLLALAALGGVLVFGILNGVVLAVALSVADMLSRVARPHSAVLGTVEGLAGMHDVGDFPSVVTEPGLVVFRYDSPLFFANAEDFHREVMNAVAGADQPVYWFLLNMEANVEVDITGLDAMEEVRRELTDKGIVVTLARVKRELLKDLESHGLVEAIGIDHIFPTMPTALQGFRDWRSEQDGPLG